MAGDLFSLYDVFNACFPTSSQKIYLPRNNPLEEYDDKKFRERFRLSKAVVHHLLVEVNEYTVL